MGALSVLTSRVWKQLLAVLVGLGALASHTPAQCPVPDQLDNGPCCTQTTPKIPSFPNFTQGALEICWRGCGVDSVLNYTARWKNLTLTPGTGMPCGERQMTLELLDTAGIAQWTGALRLVYSRTWMEVDVNGLPLQIWRFLVNGDMRPSATAGPIPCPVPSCAPAHNNRVRFTGYVDYAANCALVPTFYQHAWMLTHACDLIDHQPGFPRAGAFHPDRSYSFVGPAAGFVPGPVQPIEGTPGSFFEAMRRRNLPVPGTVGPTTCEFEERLNHSLLPNNQLCVCGAPANPQQFMLGNLTIGGGCGSVVTSPGFPFLPGFLSMGIGSWTLPGSYPGVEALRWNAGGYDYTDGCTGVLQPEVFFGVTTLGGYQAFQLLTGGPGGPLPLTFIDQANSLRPPAGGTVMNVPYVSDHILNLNH